MAETIVLYATPEHLNSMLILANFIAEHHQEVHVTIVSTASTSAAASVAAIPSITYLRLSDAATPPPNYVTNPVELFFEIPRLHNPMLLEALEEISKKSRIRAFVIDFFCNSAFEVSKSLNIPTYFYVSTGGYGLCVFLYFPTIHEITICGDIGIFNDFLEIPGCPRIHSSDFPSGMHFRESNVYKHFLDTAINMGRSDGILVNSFDALEPEAKDALVKDLCTPNSKTPPVYFLGPLVSKSNAKNCATEHECLKWLDLQPARSVIFLCFGRRGMFSAEQLKEMAVGLENSGHRFLWAVRSPPGNPRSPTQEEPDLDAILPKGFLERTKDRGFVLKSWAPQKEVLSHESVAGFVTHCGRSSALESMSFGVPMICWPLYAEQKMQREFLVEGMKVALRLEMTDDGFVTAAEIGKQVRALMKSEKGNQIWQRVAEMKTAGKAAAENGGSSVVDLEKFIRCLN